MSSIIEVNAKSNTPLGMPPKRFLSEFWQKHPLLIRQAFPNFTAPLTPNDLAGLACEEYSSARLVLHNKKSDKWTLHNGPFTEANFSKLPKTHWTLLVQDVDKWDADAAKLLNHFRFLPSWRIDDIMISYAVDHGSVGAHVDNYDVFLLQGTGKRRWQISTDSSASQEFREDAELKLLKHFFPTHEWLLEPGDMLYLPPGIPHHGIAEGECMTLSIGMRAPSYAELFVDFAEFVAERLPEEKRYTDPNLSPQKFPSEINSTVLHQFKKIISALSELNEAQFQQWFGEFITRYRGSQSPAPRSRKVSLAQLKKRLENGQNLQRNPFSRMAYIQTEANAELYAAGQKYTCSLRLARLLTDSTLIKSQELKIFDEHDLHLIMDLVNDGHFGMIT